MTLKKWLSKTPGKILVNCKNICNGNVKIAELKNIQMNLLKSDLIKR